MQQVVTLQEEIKLHIDFCKEYGLEVADIEAQEEDQATTAYTRYVLDVGNSQDWLALQVAMLPCLVGYGIIAKQLFEDPKTVKEGNRYWPWVENYVCQEYLDAMTRGSDLIEEHASKLSVSRVEELAKIFVHATNVRSKVPAVLRRKLICRRWKGVSGIWGLEPVQRTGEGFKSICAQLFREEMPVKYNTMFYVHTR